MCALDAWVTWPDRGPEATSNILYLYYTYTTLHSTFILCIHRWLLHGCFHFSVKATETQFQWPLQCNSLRANSNDQKWQHSFLLTYVLLRCNALSQPAGHTLINHGIATYWCNKSIRSLPVTTILIVKQLRDCNIGVTNPLRDHGIATGVV